MTDKKRKISKRTKKKNNPIQKENWHSITKGVYVVVAIVYIICYMKYFVYP